MSRLAWFPFYVDDFLGGTSAMLVGELGAYLAALLAQWQSGDLQAIPDDPARLARVCGGEPFPPIVRAKFKSVDIDGARFLRNTRLATIWEKQKAAHEAQATGGKRRSKRESKLPANHSATHDKNPEPITQNPEDQNGERETAPAVSVPAGLSDHPAVLLYWERFRPEDLPAISTQELIESTIGNDLIGWTAVLDYWRSNDYRPESIGKMLDKYREDRAKAKNGKRENWSYEYDEKNWI
jgi:uncharacterized protein YdaU (DUF1376 family)